MDNYEKNTIREWYNLLITEGMMDKCTAEWIIIETMNN
jgi:hypothetical protein